MYLTVRGLVLRVTNYSESDALLTLLTADQGKLTVKVRGLRRKNSPLTAPCQLLAYGEYVLFSYRGNYTVNEAHSLELFTNLRKDLLKLSLGTYFAQVADVTAPEELADPDLLPLLLNCLYSLSHLTIPLQQVKAVYELRIACICGYAPDLNGCWNCGETFPDRMDLKQGRLECSKCRTGDSQGIRMPVTPGVLSALRYICFSQPKNILAFQAGEDTLSALGQLAESYLMTQLERSFSTLDFYKTLLGA